MKRHELWEKPLYYFRDHPDKTIRVLTEGLVDETIKQEGLRGRVHHFCDKKMLYWRDHHARILNLMSSTIVDYTLEWNEKPH